MAHQPPGLIDKTVKALPPVQIHVIAVHGLVSADRPVSVGGNIGTPVLPGHVDYPASVNQPCGIDSGYPAGKLPVVGPCAKFPDWKAHVFYDGGRDQQRHERRHHHRNRRTLKIPDLHSKAPPLDVHPVEGAVPPKCLAGKKSVLAFLVFMYCQKGFKGLRFWLCVIVHDPHQLVFTTYRLFHGQAEASCSAQVLTCVPVEDLSSLILKVADLVNVPHLRDLAEGTSTSSSVIHHDDVHFEGSRLKAQAPEALGQKFIPFVCHHHCGNLPDFFHHFIFLTASAVNILKNILTSRARFALSAYHSSIFCLLPSWYPAQSRP